MVYKTTVCTLPETKAGIENLHSGKCRLSSFSPVAMRFCRTHEVLMFFEYFYAGKTWGFEVTLFALIWKIFIRRYFCII